MNIEGKFKKPYNKEKLLNILRELNYNEGVVLGSILGKIYVEMKKNRKRK